ncbi:MAG TPA: GNAT family N-acetyltransferase [Opitutaceae bacterium]|nr:GNAT family N-acetyltransferase [Opitutaceae bacterium]
MWSKHTVRSHLPPHFTPADLPLAVRFGSHRTTLRRLRADDAGRLMEFFASHSEETVYQRYGYAGVHLTPEQAQRLVGVDQTRDAALGVFEDFSGHTRLIAIGRYCLAPERNEAEAAFVVHEQRRNLGIGRTLLAALLAIARDKKLDRLVAELRQDNAPMLHVLHSAGATFESIPGTSSLAATLPVSSAPTQSPPPGHNEKPAGAWPADAAARAALRIERAGLALNRLPLP